MCGIAGILQTRDHSCLNESLLRMLNTLVHRGPDGSGIWLDESAGFALGHRRLSIVDLTASGAQPMLSECGRFVLSYNGELYNTKELRSELISKGDRFRGHSDTEVLLAALARWGVEGALKKLVGIFAFALWDRQKRSLVLARDHMGVKPIFWTAGPGGFAFASELKALATDPNFDRALDPAGLGSFLQFKYVRAPLTIYAAARALPPGSYMMVDATGAGVPQAYWRLEDVAARLAPQRRSQQDDQEAVDQLESMLSDAVSRQLVSDVPLGAFLSGGIDSSTIVSLMQRVSSSPVSTFSIGFDIPGINEAHIAKAVAAHLGTKHTELYVTEREAMDTVPKIAAIFDQPHADVSNIATYLLCQMAREHVTVSLSGDGGDELFFGYDRYFRARRLREAIAPIPPALRGFLANAIGGDRLRNVGFGQGGRISRARWSASRLLHFARRDSGSVFGHFVTAWLDPRVVAPSALADTGAWDANVGTLTDPDEQMMLNDSLTYLPDCVLSKVDRASMAVSLEARVPFMDHRVVEHAWGMGQGLKRRAGAGKWALREVLYRHVPREMVDRPKQGFDAPVGAWLRGGLRDWGEDLLSRTSIERYGALNATTTRDLWRVHQSGAVDASAYLWSLLCLQAWLKDGHPAPTAQGSLVSAAARA